MKEKVRSLYRSIGGDALLEPAVDELFGRVLKDPELVPFFSRCDLAALKVCFREFLGQMLGGPRAHSNLNLKASHAHLSIQEHHFEAVCDHLVDSLYHLGVDEDTIGEIVSALEPLASAIVKSQPGDLS